MPNEQDISRLLGTFMRLLKLAIARGFFWSNVNTNTRERTHAAREKERERECVCVCLCERRSAK